ncbi:hypothetical protein I4U23_010974 [Adineta vaga]|nr:hypothetical protein I4U23_010974 [Adineta vaga]
MIAIIANVIDEGPSKLKFAELCRMPVDGVDLRVYAQANTVTAQSVARHSACKNSIDIGSPACFRLRRGRSINTALDITSMDEKKSQKLQKRQVIQSSTSSNTSLSSVSSTVCSAPVIPLNTPIFTPVALAKFQLTLKSDNSTVVIIGSDHNLYLSSQTLTSTTLSIFTLIDLKISADKYYLIQDASRD